MTKWVAFFRNVYNGRPNNPNREQLEEAFIRAGAIEAHSFLANGTVVVHVPDHLDILEIDRIASTYLMEVSGLREPAIYRPLHKLAEWIENRPFAQFDDDETVHERMICLMNTAFVTELPLESKRGDCTVFHIQGEDAFCVSRKIEGSAGYPTQLLEKSAGILATTRNWKTILRLVNNYE